MSRRTSDDGRRTSAWNAPLLMTLMLILAACTPPPVGPAPGSPVTETVGPAGGSVSATDLAGTVLTLDFPPAAMPEPTEVTITPLTPLEGTWARFDLQPRGTALALPATIELEAGSDLDPEGSHLRFGDGIEGSALPTERDGGTLRAETTVLGYPDDGGGIAQQQGGGLNPVVAQQIACDIELTSLQIRFEQARNFPFSSSASAKQLADQIRAFIQDCETLDPNYDALIARIQSESCRELNDAEADAAVTPPTNRDQLLELARKVMNWAAAVEGSSAPCNATWLGSLEALFLDFIERYRDRVSGDHQANYNDHWNDLRLGALPLVGDTMALNLGAAQSAVAELVADLLDALRTAGYRVCDEDDTQSLLANLYSGGAVRNIPVAPPPSVPLLAPQQASVLLGYARFAASDLEGDIQRCGSRVDLDVFLDAESFPDKRATVMGGATEGAHTERASTQAPVAGVVELSGTLLAMDCPNGPDSAELALELDGTEVERLAPSGADFPLTNADLDIEAMLGQAGIDTGDQSALAGTFPLVLIREGAPCGGDYGPSDYAVFTFDVQFDPAPDITSDPSSNVGTIPAKSPTDVTFTLPYEDVGKNVERIFGTFTLAGNPKVIPIEWTVDQAGVSGFAGPTGSGSVTTTIEILCSEKGSATVTVAFELEDEFGQRGDGGSLTLNVTYGGCSSMRGGAPALQVGAIGP